MSGLLIFYYSALLLLLHLVVFYSLQPHELNTPGFPVLHHLLEFAQIHAHSASDDIQPPCPLSFPSPTAFNLSQHQGLFQ